MISKLLIANRAEIACRIMRTCRRLGIWTVAVYADADRDARHVTMADEAVHIGRSPAAESYLVGDKMIAAARLTGADAIHPGYGFLAENADFAAACAAAGLTFIGPNPEAIKTMGNKAAAKEIMAAAGIPLLPGYAGADQSDAALMMAAAEIGYPLMVKAAAGGGGKGMRLVYSTDDLPAAVAAARQESRGAFGSDELILERALLKARHIEIQIFADCQGNVIHLGERDCSVQRRHQKVVEEAPAVGMSAALRAQVGAAAVRAAQSVAYQGAGTVEFLLDKSGSFYFLEMNTRIQVEHPVTEMITGFDLVEWQLRIAEGEPLPIAQEQLKLAGHAIEARIYAEDPANAFLPVTGDIALWQPAAGAGIRVDSGLHTQDRISVHYDPLIAKVIAHGPDRKTARRRLLRALGEMRLIGLTNNITFLRTILGHSTFVAGEATTRFIDEDLAGRQPETSDLTQALIAATVAQHLAHKQPAAGGYWRNSPNRGQQYRYAGQPAVEVWGAEAGYLLVIDGREFKVTAERQPDHGFSLTVDGHRQTITVMFVNETVWVSSPAGTTTLTIESLLPRPDQTAAAAGSLRAPLPGSIVALLVQVGDQVVAEQPLLKLEAMKMEHTIRSSGPGVVRAIHYAVGDQVEADARLLTITSISAAAD